MKHIYKNDYKSLLPTNRSHLFSLFLQSIFLFSFVANVVVGDYN